jgi:hypothetical protein
MKNIYLLPTDQQSRIHKNDKGELVLCDLYFGKNTINGQHIYVTSDKQINEGDWCYSIPKGVLFKVGSKYRSTSGVVLVEDLDISLLKRGPSLEITESDCRKVILTTDNELIKDNVQEIDEDFLKTYVNNPIDKIVVQTFVRKCGVETDANGYRLMDKHEYYYKLKSI